jgi:hypothetical protein
MGEEIGRLLKLLTRICSLFNELKEPQPQLPLGSLVDIMSSVVYQVLSLHYKNGIVEEAIRLALLAFSSQVFVHGTSMKSTHTLFASAFKESLLHLAAPDTHHPILLWIIIICPKTVFGEEDDWWLLSWFRMLLTVHELHSWEQLRKALKQCAWIDRLHDGIGKIIYHRALAY